MNRIAILLTGAAVVMIAGAGCSKKEEVKSETIAEIQAREGVPVTVKDVTGTAFRVVEKQGGTVKGYNQTNLSASIPAKITAVHVSVGQRVKENDVLLSLDPESMASQYREAKAQVDMLQASYDRVKALVDEGAATQDALDQVETGLTVAKAQFDKVNKMVNVLAPFDGTMVAVNAKVNDNASPGGGQNGPPPLAIIARLDKVIVEMLVNEASINRYRKGQPAFIVVDGDTINGSISDVAISGGNNNHGFTVKAEFNNRGLKVKPGMYVTVNTVTYRKKNALQVPLESVLSVDQNPYVFTVVDGKAVKKAVTLGMRGSDTYQITDGLREGDRVVLTGLSRLAEGTKVKTVN